MVSALWKASSEGNLDQVRDLLNDPMVDLELKGSHCSFAPLSGFYKIGFFSDLWFVFLMSRSYRCDPTHRSRQKRARRGGQSAVK